MWSDILSLLEQNDIITIFPHQNADGDAQGACFGLQSFLQRRYASKRVYVLGNATKDSGRLFPAMDTCEDAEVALSLAFILDTANAARVDDVRFCTAKKTIKIDHHPIVEDFADYCIVDPTCASTCELLAELLRQVTDGALLDEKTAGYLYAGVFSDTMGFSTASTNAKTLEMAAYLALSDIAISDIAYYFRTRSLKEFRFMNNLRNQLVIENDRFAFAVVSKDMYEQCNITLEEAKMSVGEFSRIDGLSIWAVFLESEDPHKRYHGSLRSRGVIVNDIADKFGGGGHAFAAGVKLKDKTDVDAILQALRVRAASSSIS